jgi:uncharacterized membrane protein YkoI
MIGELFVIAAWAAWVLRGAHIAFQTQSVKLAPVMKKLRKGFLPVALLALGCASLAQAHGVPAPGRGGTNVQPPARLVDVQRDGISLDEAVRRAEEQYHARVVRTEVQDEDGRKVYVLKLLSDDGRVIQVRIDAATGRMR